MDKDKLKVHIKLCAKNLMNRRVKCCATCPFEKEIVREYPGAAVLFESKRNQYEKHL